MAMFPRHPASSVALCVVSVLFATASAIAQPSQSITTVHRFEPPPPAPPTSVSWRLATAEGEHVELAFSGIAPSISGQIQYVVTQDDPLGVDFQAWRAAASNPSYTRSIMTFGSVTNELPFSNPFNEFELDRITLFILAYNAVPDNPPNPTTVFIQAGLNDVLPVPEPPTWLLFMLALIAAPRSTRSGSLS
jgi:hypothetical protein